MEMLVFLLICMFLIYLSYQDFRYRAISWWLIPVLFLLLAYNNVQNASFELVYHNLAFNFIFILIQTGLLFIYFSIKNRGFVNIINNYIGIGDFLFFMVLTVCFSVFNYVVFQVVSFIIVAMFFWIFRLLKKDLDPLIPLAGGMSLLYLLMFIIARIYKINFFEDLLLSMLIKT